MRIRFVLSAFILLLALPAWAQQKTPAIDPAKEADIRRLLELSGGQRTMDNLSAAMQGHLNSMMQDKMPPGEEGKRAQEFSNKMMEKMFAYMKYDDLVELMIPVYDKHLTHDEIKGLIHFYETPLGKRLLETLPRITEESMMVMLPWARQTTERVMAEMAEEFPEFWPAMAAPNELGAVGSLRTINTACVVYISTHEKGFPATLADLGPEGEDLITAELAGGAKDGYAFEYKPLDSDGDGRFDAYQLRANPLEPGVTGLRFFFTDESAVIRFSLDGPASADSPLIG